MRGMFRHQRDYALHLGKRCQCTGCFDFGSGGLLGREIRTRSRGARALDAGRDQREHQPGTERPQQWGLEVRQHHGRSRKARTWRW